MDVGKRCFRQLLHLLLVSCGLAAAAVKAAYPGAYPGPHDLPETLKTPWYYASADFACYDSQQAIAQAYINGRIGGRVCDSQYVGNDPDFPSDPLAGRRVDVPYCMPPDSYNIPVQNAIPYIGQNATFNFLTQVVSTGSSCPGGTWLPESRVMIRESYEYCPRGYDLKVNNESPDRFFCQLQEPVEDSGELCAGNPISIGTGNKQQRETDFTDTRKGYLKLERHYNNYRWGAQGMFGANWTSSFERRIIFHDGAPGFVTAVRATGLEYQYIRQADGSWLNNTDSRETLAKSASGWTYTSTDDETENYDAAGRLQSIVYVDGTVLTMAYGNTGLLETVLSSSGESLVYFEDPSDTDSLVDSVTVETGVGQPGRTWKYRYDVNNNLEFVLSPDGTAATDSDNPVRQYFYEDPVYRHALTGIKDERNIRYATFEYTDAPDQQGNATRSFHGSSSDPVETVIVDYHGDSHAGDNTSQRTVTNSRGETTVYQTVHINGKALPTSISGPGCSTCSNGGMSTYSYHPNSTNLFLKTENGVTTAYGNYDARGNPGYMIEAMDTGEERRTDYSYDSRYFRKPLTITEPSVYPGANKVTTYSYDDFGNRISERIDGYTPTGLPVSRTLTRAYDGPLHQLSQINGSRTDVSDITNFRYYDDDPVEGINRARLREVENASGILVRSNIQYTATGKVASESHPNGLNLSYSYYPGNDRLETLTQTGSNGSHVTRWSYLATGEVESITTADGTPDAVTVMFTYDAARRLIRISDALGNHIDYLLDSESNRTGEEVYDSAGVLRKALTRTFDAYNRPDVRSQVNETIDTDYAPNGGLQQQTDGNGVISTFAYDALNRLLVHNRDTGGVNAQTAYSHDVADRVTSVIDPLGGMTGYQYDDLGNLLELSSPDTGMIRYSYDDAGNMTGKLDAKGQWFSYSYDSLNRLTLIDAPGTADDISYAYDGCTQGSGKLCTISMGASVVAYSYDAFGNITAHQALSYDYDAANRIYNITYPSGFVVNYQYDAAGQVIRIELSGNEVNTVLAREVRYLPFGDKESLRYGNGATLIQSMDTAFRLTGQTVSGVLELANARFDANGNLLTRVDGASGSSDYSYDSLNRLTVATGAFGNRHYGYDMNGNRVSLDDGVQVTYGYEPQSNRLDSESGWRYTLDANGNTVARLNAVGAGRLYTFNAHNRLLTAVDRSIKPVKGKNKPPQIVDSLLGRYSYNGLGQRFSKKANGTVSQFVYDTDGKLMAELDESGVVTRDYVYINNQLLAVLDYSATGNAGGEDVIVDNGLPPAGWTSISSKKDHGEDYLFSSGGSENNIRWIPDLEAGNYDVYAWYVRNRKNSDTVPYTIMHGSNSEVVTVDQTTGGGNWQLLGNFSFDGAGDESVEVSDSTGGTSADATRFVRTGGSANAVTTTISYVHNDHLGTPQVMTDESGNEVWRAVYDPFGDATVDTESSRILNIRFPGQYFDQETGLHYNYFRYLDPSIGRYSSSDPIGLYGGMNTYAYVVNNPILLSDSSGLMTYQCRKPLDAVGGSGIRSGPDLPGNPLYHQYSCIIEPQGKITCGGQDRVGSVFGSLGMPSNDIYKPKQCEKVLDDNQCFEKCVIDEWTKPRPWYGIPFGTDCQEYDNSVHKRCNTKCGT